MSQNEPHKSAGKSAGLQVRLVSLRLLSAVIDKKISLDGLTDAQGGQPAYLALEPRDRRLVRAIVLSSLRQNGVITAALARFTNRPLPQNARTPHHLLTLTAAQILYLDIPDYACVNLAVTIAKADSRLRRFAPLVNALARKIAQHRDEIIERSDQSLNAPAWFYDMLERHYGKPQARAIIAAQASPPALDITVKDNAKAWADTLKGRILPGHTTVRFEESWKNITDLSGFAHGHWWVQDVAASLPVLLLGDVRGKKIADLCAAPGGKTAQLAHLGADVTAFDSSPSRMQRLNENMQRLKLDVKTQIGDVRHFAPPQLFDAVLCDAPCSSTGTCRRHPDILWTKSPADIARLAKLQLELLETALRFTKPGGRVVFSNCSLSVQEGEELLHSFLQTHKGQARLSAITTEELPAAFAALINSQGFLRSTPADLAEFGGMDGFFAARIEKL